MDNSELTAQSRAAKAAYLMFVRGQMTTGELAESLGVTPRAVHYIMNNLSAAGIPVCGPEDSYWSVDREWLSRELGLVIMSAASRGVPQLE